MKLKFLFNPQALKNIKPTLQLIYKLLQTTTPYPNVYLIYFIKPKNIRLLIDSEKNPTVISLGSQMLNLQSNFQFKKDREFASIQFQNTETFFENLIGALEKEDQFGLFLDVKREIFNDKELKFLKITLKNNDKFVSRISIETPKYDVSQMRYHPFISGSLQTNKKAEFTIYLDQILNMMRYMLKIKPVPGTKLCIDFNLSTRTYNCRSSDPHCLPYTIGQIKMNSNSTLQTQFHYQINIPDLKAVNQILRKLKQLKVMISSNNHLVFLFIKEDLFMCHMDMFQWIYAVQEQGYVKNNGMKIQQGQEIEQINQRWD